MPLLDVLMTVSFPSFVTDVVEKRYRLHKLWEAQDPAALIAHIQNDVQFLLTTPPFRHVNGAFMRQFPQLKGVINFGVGYDAIDANWAGENGLMVTHTPSVLNDEVADLSMGLLLAVMRQIPQADQYLRAGQWEKQRFPLSASLKGRTMGILGLGRIGKAIATRAAAFGLKILYHGRHEQQGVPYPYYPHLRDMARDCDILMVIAPGTPETLNIVNQEILDALGPQGVLINMARGSLVDEDALIESLESHKILSAGLDVYAQEPHVSPRLIALPHVVLLPHIGPSSVPTFRAMSDLVLANLDALAQGKPPLTPVPETPYRQDQG